MNSSQGVQRTMRKHGIKRFKCTQVYPGPPPPPPPVLVKTAAPGWSAMRETSRIVT